MRATLTALALSLTLVACDASAPDTGPPVADGFLANVSGDLERSVTGPAVTSPLGGTGVTVQTDEDASITGLLLESEDSDDRFVLVGVTAGETLVPGTYAFVGLGSKLGPGDFYGVYQFPIGETTTSVAIAESGSVTVSRADADQIVGTFEFEARAVTGSDADGPTTGEVSVEGAFVVAVREIDGGGER